MAGESSKKTRGRQQIEMKKIEKDEEKLITFSKRRSGIYKKVSELVTLTGAEIAFLVFSPAGKPFSFAHPSMEAIINRFLEIQGEPSDDTTHPLVEAHRKIRIGELTQEHNELLEQLEVEMGKEKELKQKKTGGEEEEKGWWSTPVEELNLQQMQEMEATLRNTLTGLITNFRERTRDGSHASSSSSAQRPQAQAQTRVEGQPQPFGEKPPPHMFNIPFPFDSNLTERNVDGVHASSSFPQVQVQVQAQAQAQAQPFEDQPPPYMFNPFAYDPNLPPNYDNWPGQM